MPAEGSPDRKGVEESSGADSLYRALSLLHSLTVAAPLDADPHSL